jgi:glycosyltransferase involved in cell wall biosynthesis
MSAARPLVASQMGRAPEIINDNETGLLVPPGDVPQLAHAMQRLAEDPALRPGWGPLLRCA